MFVGLVALCVLLGLLRRAIDPAGPAAASGQAVAPAKPLPSEPTPAPAPAPTSPAIAPALPAAPEVPDLDGQDTVNPCTSGHEPGIPADYETMVAQGITVAWSSGEAASASPYGLPASPMVIAHLVTGILEEAAALTGTPRRPRLAVVVHPSSEVFLARTHAPSWAGGAYDGGAIHLMVKPTADLGIAIPTLRHELMHAQLHAAVGCMPTWFNEGLAMYFAGSSPMREWLQMLRSADDFDLSTLRAPRLTVMPEARASRVYAESLAMIVFLVERSGESGLQGGVQALAAAARESQHRELDLWERLYPGASHRAVLEALAHKIFGVMPGSELDNILAGAVCCYGLRSVHELHCRGAPPRQDPIWIDKTATPLAVCHATW